MVSNEHHQPNDGSHHRRGRSGRSGEIKHDALENSVKQEHDTESVESLQAQLSEERNRADGYLEQWKRATADYQNYKRRIEQEREEYGRLANTAILLNILPAVDDLDRALVNVDAPLSGQKWVEGIEAIHRKLKGALEASGLAVIPAEGETFDPNVHEAISDAPGEHGQVVAEVRPGYRLGSRVIRPALVVVGNGN